MVCFITKCVFLFSVTIGTLNGINCQLAAIATRLPQIINLLENVTDSSATMSRLLPHLGNLLQNQEDVQILTNLLLANNTATADEVASVLPVFERILQSQQEKQDQVVALLHIQQENHNQTQNAVNRMEDTLTQIASTQAQMASTQTQMANTFDQIANLLQMQTQQLDNMTSTLTHMVGQLDVQNEKWENCACSNPLMQATTTVEPTVPSQSYHSQGYLQENFTRDCSDIAALGCNISQVYTITPQNGQDSIRVYCDMDTDGGNWTVFQRRFNGSVDFYRGWDNYEQGFGSADGEYWMGLRHIRHLTQTRSWILRINLEAFSGSTAYAEYESFQLGDAASNYTLSIGAYHGTAGDSLPSHNHQAFSTKDRDHDTWYDNCAQRWQGAWWYYSCLASNLNGLYPGPTHPGTSHPETMSWLGWPYYYTPLKGSEMMIRPVQ